MFSLKCLVSCLLFASGGFANPLQNISGNQGYPGQVVFLGDSITSNWANDGNQTWAEFYEPVGAVNLGIAGDQTAALVSRIMEGMIDNLNTRLVVLMIGTNDLSWGELNEDEVSLHFGYLVNAIRRKSPRCKILILGVLPREEPDIHQKINNLNSMISQLANSRDLYFLNMGANFSTGPGQLVPGLYSDGVHLTSEGYRVWARLMNPIFFELLQTDEPTTTPRSNWGQVVFLGDSITDWWRFEGLPIWDRYYEPLGAVNTGVGGDATTDVIRRITSEGIIDDMNARVAVLKIGTNDVWKNISKTETVNNIETILNLIRERNPGVSILLLGILPRAPRESHLIVNEINVELPKFASASHVWFLNMNDAFSYDWGMVFPELYWADSLHLTEEGYARWADIMNPLLFQILNGTATKPAV